MGHSCDIDDLDYHYRQGNSQVYRINCRVCGRNWNLRVTPGYDGKLIGVWNNSAPGPNPEFRGNAEWARLICNGAPQALTVKDLEFSERLRIQREAMRDPVKEAVQEFREKEGIKKWVPPIRRTV